MSCRIGIITEPDKREKFWKGKYKYRKFRNWKIIKTFRTKTNAQKWETEESDRLGCVSHAGGDGPEKATWHGYKFNFD